MAINWDLYNKRLNINGSTSRERNLQCLQNTITNKLPDLLSCKAVKINGVDTNIEIVKTAKDYIKVIHSLPNTSFDCGDYVLHNSKTYLITEIDADDEVYTTGKMQECTFILPFQSPDGTILSYPCITSGKSFNNDENKVITLPSNQKSVLLPFDDNTKTLKTDRRLFIDKLYETPFQIIGSVDNTTYNYGDKGLIYFITEQRVLQEQDGTLPKDRSDLGICNYFEPTVIPTPPDPDIPTEIVTITSDATDNQVILGITYTFSATFKNELGQDVDNVVAQYSIDENYGGKVVLVDNGDKTATITVGDFDDTDLCMKQFTLKCYDVTHGFESTVLLTIVGMF